MASLEEMAKAAAACLSAADEYPVRHVRPDVLTTLLSRVAALERDVAKLKNGSGK